MASTADNLLLNLSNTLFPESPRSTKNLADYRLSKDVDKRLGICELAGVDRLSILQLLFIKFFAWRVSWWLVFSSVFAESRNDLIVHIQYQWFMLHSAPIFLANLFLLVLILKARRMIFFAEVVLTTDGWLPSLKLLLNWELIAILDTILLTARAIVLLVVCVSLFSCQQILDAIHDWSYLITLLWRLLHDPRARVTHRLNYNVVEVVLAFTKHLNISFTSTCLLLRVLLRNLLLHLLLLWKWGLIWVCVHHGGILDLLHLNLKSLCLVEVVALDRDLLLCV